MNISKEEAKTAAFIYELNRKFWPKYTIKEILKLTLKEQAKFVDPLTVKYVNDLTYITRFIQLLKFKDSKKHTQGSIGNIAYVILNNKHIEVREILIEYLIHIQKYY